MATTTRWIHLQEIVYRRDGGCCVVCGIRLIRVLTRPDVGAARRGEIAPFECGHLQDRCRGGQDDVTNVVAMCGPCNRSKPRHSTTAEALDWLAATRQANQGKVPRVRGWSDVRFSPARNPARRYITAYGRLANP